MATPSRAEVEAAFQQYLRLGAYERNWNAWADLFTEDALYVEVQYGTFRGREEIRRWITSTMATVPG
jgi:ketosteroid isomerase-like protein